MLNSFDLRESPLLMIQKSVQYRFPKSKKRRIRKKWSKRPWNFRLVPRECCYQFGNQIIVSPGLMAKIQAKLLKQEEDRFLRCALTPPPTPSRPEPSAPPEPPRANRTRITRSQR